MRTRFRPFHGLGPFGSASAGPLRAVVGAFAVATVLAAGVMTVVLVVHVLTDIPTRAMTSDATAVLEGPFYTGFVPMLGYATWAASGAILLLAASVIPSRLEGDVRPLLATLGVFSVALFIDDALLLHEVVIPEQLGVPEAGTYLLYAIAAVALLWRFTGTIWRHPHGALLLATVALLGATVLIDQIDLAFGPWRFFEAAVQLQGTFAWFAFAWCASRDALRRQSLAAEGTPARVHDRDGQRARSRVGPAR